MSTYHEEEPVFLSGGQSSALEQLINEVVSLINDFTSTHLVSELYFSISKSSSWVGQGVYGLLCHVR